MMILWRLVLAHMLADFTLQTNLIADWKRRSHVGGLVHSAIFFAAASLLCYPSLGQPWVHPFGVALNGWVTLAVLSILHFVEDAWRVWTIKKLNSPDSFFFFLLDQFIHLSFIVACFPRDDGSGTEPWIQVALLVIILTHFSSVFIYFMEKDLFGDSSLLDDSKYYFMMERLLVAGALLLPGLAAPAGVLVIWAAHALLYRLRKPDRYSLLNAIVGNALALSIGLVARQIIPWTH